MPLNKLENQAFNIFNKVNDLLKNKSDIQKAFRARARDFPVMVESEGLVSSLLFYYSKATEKVYQEIVHAIEEGKLDGNEKEKQAYSLYLYIVLNALSLNNFIEDDDVKTPLNAIKKLTEKNISVRAFNAVKPLLLYIKRLSDALFSSEEEG